MTGLPDEYTEYTLHKNGDAYFATVTVDLEKQIRDMIDRYFVEKEDTEAERQLAELGFVKVVRCKDCKYYYKGMGSCMYFDRGQGDLEGFCDWGERQ